MAEKALSVDRGRLPMDEAADLFHDLCSRIEDGQDLNTAMLEILRDDAEVELTRAVDRRIALKRRFEDEIRNAKRARKDYSLRSKQFQMFYDAFKDRTKLMLEVRPGLKFIGTLGKIRIQRNGTPKLMLCFGDKDLTPGMIQELKIEDRFVNTKTTYSIDMDAVKNAMLLGETIPWATLHHGTQVRFG